MQFDRGGTTQNLGRIVPEVGADRPRLGRTWGGSTRGGSTLGRIVCKPICTLLLDHIIYSLVVLGNKMEVGDGNSDLMYIVPHLNCLQDQNRLTRRRALETIRREIKADDRVAPEQRVVEIIIRPLLRAFSDPVEKCREIAIKTVSEVLELTEEPCTLLQYIIPTLVQRLAQQEIVEPSEELRLKLVQLMRSAIGRCKVHVAPYLDDLVCCLIMTDFIRTAGRVYRKHGLTTE